MKISPVRTAIALACIVGVYALLQFVSGTKRIPILAPLERFPAVLGPYTLQTSRRSPKDVEQLLHVDDYIDYSYLDPQGRTVQLYVAFYESVGTGGGYHSPKNCLPGSGWGIDTVEDVTLNPPNAERSKPVTVSRMIIRNGAQYQVVLYWYQNRGRIIASEYWEKIYLILDALFKGRRDGSFVRLIMPCSGEKLGETEKELQQFATLILGELDKYIPGTKI